MTPARSAIDFAALMRPVALALLGKPNASRRSSRASSPPPASFSRCIASTWKARAPTRPTSNPARPASGVPPEARSAWAASLSTGGCSLARASNRPRRRWRCSTFRVGRPSNANRLTLRQAFKDFADFPNGEFDKLTGADAGDANGDGKQGRPVEWDGLEPWSESVDGAALLDALVVLLERYASQPDGGAVAVALWALYTWTFRAFAVAPNLMITAPERESGKTRVTELLSWAVPRAKPASDASAAAIIRGIERDGPTLLFDEAQHFLNRRPDDPIRGILLAGFTKRFAMVERCEGDGHEVRVFSTFCPKAMNGRKLATIDDMLTSRSVVIPMMRARKPLPELRADRDPVGEDVRRQCAHDGRKCAQRHVRKCGSTRTASRTRTDGLRPRGSRSPAAG